MYCTSNNADEKGGATQVMLIVISVYLLVGWIFKCIAVGFSFVLLGGQVRERTPFSQ